jgi:UDP-GlcNAc:undecaprenyl-phosphate GlcNAc-1-phosphate transferase
VLTAALFMAAFLATLMLIAVLRPFAAQLGLLDWPTLRKAHGQPVPNVGGLAMGLAFLGCCLLARGLGPRIFWLAAAAAIVLAGGLLDDRNDLGALPKFGFQAVAAFLIVHFDGATLDHLGALLGPHRLVLGAIAGPLTVFAIVGVMNALNMADGMDGLAGGLALVATIWFAVAAANGAHALELQVACALAGLLLAFLLFNARIPGRRRALVFMGDAGSLFLGLVLAWLAIRLSAGEQPALAPITAVWIVGVPLADCLALLLRRTWNGRNPFRADRGHLHHLLQSFGLGHGRVSSILFAASFVMGGIGYLGARAGVPEYIMFGGYCALWIAYYRVTCQAFRARVHDPLAAASGRPAL